MTDVELLARLIQCEAGGEGNIGMSAVATVLMNRVLEDTGEYGRYNTVRDVVYAPRQFECVRHPTQNLANMSPEPIHYAIAEWALAGNRLTPVAEALWFYAPYGAECRQTFPNNNGRFVTRIGGHCFFVPTASYVDT